MYNRIKALLSITTLMLCTSIPSFAQQFCPPNINFENGNLGNWSLYTGSCCPINTPTLSGPVAGRHTITTGSGVDQYGGFPIVAPGGEVYSLKLGNNGTGAQAERARYYIHVPTGAGSYFLIYRYAVVFQDPNHTLAEQPRFEVKAYDSATNSQLACNAHTYVASSSLPGFTLSTVGSSVYYKAWTTSSIDLNGYGGKTIAIDFASGDCDLGGHFGYGYVDMNCGLFKTTSAGCTVADSLTLFAPPGFQHYVWMDSALTTVIDTVASTKVLTPSDTTTFAVILTPYTGFGCPDTLYTIYYPPITKLIADAKPDTTICSGNSVKLDVTSNSPSLPYNYTWWNASGTPGTISCTNCAQPSVSPTALDTFFVIVTDTCALSDTDMVIIHVNPTPVANAGTDTTLCPGKTVTMQGSGAGNYEWYPATYLSSTTIANPQSTPFASTTYNLAVTNSYGCSDTDQVDVSVYAVPTADAGQDTGACPGNKVVLTGTGGGTYSWTPTANITGATTATPTATVNSTINYVLTVTNSYGCKDTDTVAVQMYPKPIVNAGNDTSACAEAMIHLHGTGLGDYYWTPDTPNMWGSQIANPLIYVITSKTYKLIILNNKGCSDSDFVNVTVKPKPVANAGNDATVCEFAYYQLQGAGGIGYSWTPTTGMANPATATPTIHVLNSQTYSLVVTNSVGCADTDQVDVTMSPKPVANAGTDVAVCRFSQLLLNGSGGSTYSWTPANKFIVPTVANPKVLTDSTRTYTVVVTTADGCKDTDDVTVTVYNVPKATAGRDTGVCTGEKVNLWSNGGGSYLWSPSAGLDDPTKQNPVATVTGDIIYQVTVTNSDGCSDVSGVVLKAYPYPKVAAGNDSTVCPGAKILLNATSEASVTYSWTPTQGLSASNIKNPEATIDGPISYSVTVRNSYGCETSDVVSFTTLPFEVGVGNDTVICRGDTAHLSAWGGHHYLWTEVDSLAGGRTATPTVWPVNTHDFVVNIIDTFCNRVEPRKVNVYVNPLPELKIVTTPKDCGLETGKLEATGAKSYKWTPDESLDDAKSATTKAFPKVTTIYMLTGIDDNGCMDTASTVLQVFQGEGRIFMPDAFTPNGDNLNDCYHVTLPPDVTKFELQIANRWGQVVYQTSSFDNNCWDGRFKGQDMEIGTYQYYYRATSTLCGDMTRKGSIQLIR